MQTIEQIFFTAINNHLTLKKLTPLSDQSLFELLESLNIKSQELLIVLEELLMNSIEHGGGQMQFHYDLIDDHFYFVLQDKGDGIHKNVPRNPRLSDTAGKSTTSILRLALEEGITGTGTIGRGMGLFYLSKFIHENDAESIVASNGGMIIQQKGQFSEKAVGKDVEGTLILIKVKASLVGQ